MSCSGCSSPQCSSWFTSTCVRSQLLVFPCYKIMGRWGQINQSVNMYRWDVSSRSCWVMSSRYMCLDSVTCWWRYLVRYGRLEVSFLYGRCYLFLPYLCILFSVVQLRIVQSNQLRTSTWCWSWDQHVAILSSAKWFSFVLSMIRWLWQGVGMVMHRYAYECLEELGKS